jgi:hypothetical protein
MVSGDIGKKFCCAGTRNAFSNGETRSSFGGGGGFGKTRFRFGASLLRQNLFLPSVTGLGEHRHKEKLQKSPLNCID